jgi:BMFP domain-containing protein YqiC
MPTELKDTEKREIPAFENATGKREVTADGMSLLDIVNASLNEYRSSIKTELSKLEQRISAIESRETKEGEKDA